MSAAVHPSTVQRALSAHAAIGLVAGALLYLVCLTGTISVFYAELQRLEQPVAPEMAQVEPSSVQRAVEAVLASEKGKPLTTHLYVHLPVKEVPRTTITTDTQAVHADADGSIAGPEEIAWSDFLIALHYQLNVPGSVGLTIVGVLGVMILALVINGVLAHPRIFRDAFRLRARDKGGLALADWHNRLSVWTLPFSIAIALTGAVIGLGTIATLALAAMYEKGQTEEIYAPIFGEEAKPDKRPASAPDVATPLAYMAAHHPDLTVTYATVHDPLTAGQHVQISALHPRRLIYGETYNFDARGHFHGKVGLSDGALGQQASASLYNLHFGNFGGLPVKLAYLVFGSALTVICATGVSIWLGKRRRRGHDEPGLARAWDAVVWGMPMVLTLSLVLRFVIGNAVPLVAVFWIGSLVVLATSVFRVSPPRYRRALQALLVLLLGAVIALRI